MQDLLRARDLPTLLADLAQGLPHLLPVHDRVSLAFVEPDGQFLRVHRLVPATSGDPSDLPRVRVRGTVVGEVARDGQPRVVTDVRDDDNLRFGRASHEGVRSTASVPVRVDGRVVGVMNVGSRQIGACAQDMLAALADLAAHIGPAVYQAELRARRPLSVPAPEPEPALVSRSPAMRDLLAYARRAAASDVPVLITGETGVGKSLLARQIHRWSRRSDAPFATVSLAEGPGTALDSVLAQHPAGGTLFLDEVGEAPLAVQAALLRRTLEGGGADAATGVPLRLVAATHRDLHAAVAKGEFRRDLLYRLDVVTLAIPPLRDRPEDLELLVAELLASLGRSHQRTLRLAPTAWPLLRAHAWPGNVRELASVLLRAVLREDEGELTLRHFQPGPPDGAVATPARTDDWPTRDEHERRYLRKVLVHTGGAIEGARGAARLLGMLPSTLRSRMKRLGVDPDSLRIPRRK